MVHYMLPSSIICNEKLQDPFAHHSFASHSWSDHPVPNATSTDSANQSFTTQTNSSLTFIGVSEDC